MHRIMVVDNDAKALRHMATAAQIDDAEIVTASSAQEAIRRIHDEVFDLVVTDMKMETDEAGLDVLKAAKQKDIYTQVIVITAFGTPELSIETMRLGAFDYMEKNMPGTDVYAMIKSKVGLALEFRDAKLQVLKESGVR